MGDGVARVEFWCQRSISFPASSPAVSASGWTWSPPDLSIRWGWVLVARSVWRRHRRALGAFVLCPLLRRGKERSLLAAGGLEVVRRRPGCFRSGLVSPVQELVQAATPAVVVVEGGRLEVEEMG